MDNFNEIITRELDLITNSMRLPPVITLQTNSNYTTAKEHEKMWLLKAYEVHRDIYYQYNPWEFGYNEKRIYKCGNVDTECMIVDMQWHPVGDL